MQKGLKKLAKKFRRASTSIFSTPNMAMGAITKEIVNARLHRLPRYISAICKLLLQSPLNPDVKLEIFTSNIELLGFVGQ
uniref:Uncharacterized protein n=1 Tax=Nelumbo nucifera TaxID=4432 RepID=A0A822ZNK2_NELNU|nr:TPA_asm: hypothetical protein HUJ06_003315 [Nelumbo nucifera]